MPGGCRTPSGREEARAEGSAGPAGESSSAKAKGRGRWPRPERPKRPGPCWHLTTSWKLKQIIPLQASSWSSGTHPAAAAGANLTTRQPLPSRPLAVTPAHSLSSVPQVTRDPGVDPERSHSPPKAFHAALFPSAGPGRRPGPVGRAGRPGRTDPGGVAAQPSEWLADEAAAEEPDTPRPEEESSGHKLTRGWGLWPGFGGRGVGVQTWAEGLKQVGGRLRLLVPVGAGPGSVVHGAC